MPKRSVEEEGRARGAITIAYLDSDTYARSEKGRKTTEDKWIWKDWIPPSKRQRKLMIALLLREQVRVMMRNHLYTFGGELYRQESGGAIGLQITSTAARGVLRLFNREYKRKLVELDLKPLLHKRYVDDNNMGARAVPLNFDVKMGEGGLEVVRTVDDAGREVEAD